MFQEYGESNFDFQDQINNNSGAMFSFASRLEGSFIQVFEGQLPLMSILLLFCSSLIDGGLFQVTSPYGNNLHLSENVTHGQFAFTTTEAGNYLACFWLTDLKHEAGVEISVNLDWRTGIAAKDWESVARKEKIEVTTSSSPFHISLQLVTSIPNPNPNIILVQGVELELRKLEGAVEAIHENLLYLKDR